jgi:SpoIID/LytB domain protein
VVLMTMTASGTRTTGRLFTVIALVAAAVTVFASTARAIPDSTPITIHGTGWGHHVGMPHWATQGQAVQGWQYEDILDYWYPGTQVEHVDEVYAPVRPVPDPIRVGIDYVWTGAKQYRPFMWQRFNAVNGDVSICLQGETEGACSYVAQPGETWEFGYTDNIGGECYLLKNGVDQGIDPSECETHLYWSDQPNTRVSFPGSDVSRVFARGHVEFVPAVGTQSPYNGWTGFHLVIEMPLEEYLYGLAEVPPSWGLEALKANAVASRTYAAYRTIYNLGRTDCSCDIVWDTTGQWYVGWRSNSDLTEGDITYGARWRQAVNDTAGEVRIFVYESNGNRRVAETYYSTISGGATENVWDMWNPNAGSSYKAKYAYLGWKPDPWSSLYNGTHSGYPKVTNAVWAKNTTAGAIRNALTESGAPVFDEILSIQIVNRRPSGSPDVIRVSGLKNGSQVAREYTGNQLQAKLGLVSHFIQAIGGTHSPERWAGANRYSTSADVSEQTHPGGAAIVYLAVGTLHPDALAGGPAAAQEGAPILLVRPDSLPSETAAELRAAGTGDRGGPWRTGCSGRTGPHGSPRDPPHSRHHPTLGCRPVCHGGRTVSGGVRSRSRHRVRRHRRGLPRCPRRGAGRGRAGVAAAAGAIGLRTGGDLRPRSSGSPPLTSWWSEERRW